MKNSGNDKSEFITIRFVCHLSDNEIVFTSADIFAESIDKNIIFLIYYPQNFTRFKETLDFNTTSLKSPESYKIYQNFVE